MPSHLKSDELDCSHLSGMEVVVLVLTRKVGERIAIGDLATVCVVKVDNNSVRIGIEAPPEIDIRRIPETGSARLRRSSSKVAKSSRFDEVKRVLIVDDCRADREAYRRFLLKDPHRSYSVLEAESGEQGLRMAWSEAPDCLLLDYRLPDLDGVEFMAELGGQRTSANPAVLMLSRYGSADLEDRALTSGIDRFLPKRSVTDVVLRRAVARVMSNRSEKLGGRSQSLEAK